MADLVIKNGKIVTPSQVISAGIAVDKGKIVAISKEDYLPPADKTIDASGKYVLPGLVDPHVHIGYVGKFADQSRTESRAAVAGGVTTWGAFVVEPGKGFLEIFDRCKKEHEDNAICDAFFHNLIGIQRSIDDIPQCPAVGVNSFKFNLGYKGTPQAKIVADFQCTDGVLLTAFEIISKLGRPVLAMVHAENGEIIMALRERLEKKEKRKDFRAWRDSRPNFVEAEAIKVCLEIARITNCPLYIVHNTIGEAVDIINEAKARGQEVVGETCPPYLTHTSDEPIQMFIDQPALGQVNPPLRDKESIDKLWKGLRDGIIETIGSDQVQLTRAQKGNDIWTAPMGLSNVVEMILPVMLSEGVNKGRISLPKLVEVCSCNPARVFGIYPRKGTIEVDSDADLVVVDLKKRVKLTLDMLHSSADWNIYEGWDFTGWPVMTLLRGQVVMENGKILAKPGIGKYIPCRCE